MKDQLRRVLALVMSVMMLCGNLPITAIAETIDRAPVIKVDDVANDADDSTNGDATTMLGDGKTVVDVASGTQPFANLGIMPIANLGNLEYHIEIRIGGSSSAYYVPESDEFLAVENQVAYRIVITNKGSSTATVTLSNLSYLIGGTQPGPDSSGNTVDARLLKLKAEDSSASNYKVSWNSGNANATVTINAGATAYVITNGSYKIPSGSEDKNSVYSATLTYNSQSQRASLSMPVNSKTLYFGYNLAVEGAEFPDQTDTGETFRNNYKNSGVDVVQKVYELTDGTRIMSNGTTGAGAKKYLHAQLYAVGDTATITSIVPNGPDASYGFIGWYDKKNPSFYGPNGTLAHNTDQAHSVDGIWVHLEVEGNEQIYDGTEYSVINPKFVFDCERNEANYKGQVDKIMNMAFTSATLTYDVTGADNKQGSITVTKQEYEDGAHNGNIYSGEATIDFGPNSLPKFTNAGTYNVHIKGVFSFDLTSGDPVTAIVEKTVQVIIHPRPVLVKVKEAEHEYDGTAWTINRITGQAEYEISNALGEYQTEFAGNTRAAKALTAGKIGFVAGDDFADGSFTVVYNGSDANEVLPGTYPASIKTDYTKATKGDDLNMPKVVKGTEEKSQSYVYLAKPGELKITGSLQKLTIHKKVVGSTKGGTFNFTVSKNGTSIKFVKDNTLGYLESTVTGASETVSVVVPEGSTEASVDVYVLFGANQNSVTCTVTEQLSTEDAKKYEVSYSTDGNNYTKAASQTITLQKSAAGHVYVKNSGKYYVAHYLNDLNDAGNPVPKSTSEPLADEGYAYYFTEEDAYVMTEDITYAKVHEKYQGTTPTGWEFSDQHIFSPNTPSGDGKDKYTSFKYAVKGTMKNKDNDANGDYLENHPDNVEPGDTVKVYWDRILEYTKQGDDRYVSLDKTATNEGKENSIRQSKIIYATEYELWEKIQDTTGNSGIPNLEAKDAWQYTNAIDLALTNTPKKLKYIFHTVLAQQVKSYVAPKDNKEAGEKDYGAITISDTEIEIDNLKGGTNDTKVYLVPLIQLDYYIDGKPAGVTDTAEYTVNVENMEAAGDRNSATNSKVGTTYKYNYTPVTAPAGKYYTESDWKLRTHAEALATELTDMSANKLAKSDLYVLSNGGRYAVNDEGYLQVQLHRFTYTIEKTVKIMRPSDADPDQLTEVTGSAKAGDQLVYTVTVTNNAPYSITKELTDEFTVGGESKTLSLEGAGLNGKNVTVPAAEYELVNGLLSEKKAGTVTLTATYTVENDDVDSAVNKVTITDGPSDEVTTEIDENPDWKVEKTATITHKNVSGYCGNENELTDMAHVGDTVSYVIKVTNTGNTELTLTLTDEFTATNALPALTNVTTNGGVAGQASSFTLQIGEFIEFTAEYTVDVADQELVNKAIATDPDDPDHPKDTTVTTPVNNPGWKVEKSVSGMTGGFIDDDQTARKGDILTYTITVTNTGNVKPLTGLILTDNLGDLTAATVTGGTLTKKGNDWVLDMTADVATITYPYTVKATDIGKTINNTATVESAPDAPKDPHSDNKHSDSTTTETEGWSIVKKLYKVNGDTVDENGQINGEDVKIMVGDTVQYVLIVENKSSVELNDLTVTDTLSGLLEDADNQPSYKGFTPDTTTGASYASGKLSKLGKGQTVGLIFEYEVQDGDAFLSNSAEASKPKYKDDKTEDTSKAPDKEENGPVENVVYCMLTVDKVWMEQDGKQAIDPDVLAALLGTETITIEVYRDDEAAPVASVTMPQAAPADKWSKTFGPLPLADDNGENTYTYTVVETGVDGGKILLGKYTYEVSVSKDTSQPFTYHVTNTLQNTEEEEKPVKKAEPQTADKKVEIGDYIEYTITHTSPMATTTKATITDELPTGLAFAGKEAGRTTVVTIKVNGTTYSLPSNKVTENESNGTITWTIEDVPPMADIEIVFYAKVTSDAATITGDTLDNDATVKQENKSGGIYEETTDEVKVPVKKPNLSITKIAKDENGNELVGAVTPGQTFTYVITVTNNGEGKAKDIKVLDKLSNYLMYEGYTTAFGSASIDNDTKTPKGYGGEVTWTFDELASGASATLTIKVTLYATKRGHVTADKSESQKEGNDVLTFDFVPDFDNTATIEAGDKKKDKKEEAVKHVDVADFIIQKDVKIVNTSGGDPKIAELGDGIVYTITVKNVGGIALKDFTLTDDMFKNADDGSMKVTIDGVDVDFTANGKTVTIAGPLDVDKEAIITYTRTVTPELIYDYDKQPGASIVNTVKAQAKYTDPDSNQEKDTLEHNNSIDVTLVDSDRGWLVEKEVSGMTGVDENGKPYARVGDVLTYTIRVTNKGNVVLHSLNLADTLTIDKYTADLAHLLEKDEEKSNTDAVYEWEIGTYGRIEAADPDDVTSGLRPGETIVLTYTRTAAVTAEQLGDDVVNTVTVTHPTADNNYDPAKDPDFPDTDDPTRNPSTATVTTPVENYGVEKSVGVMKDGKWVDLETAGLVLNGKSDEEGVPAGTVLVYHITVTNESDFELHDILVTDKFGTTDVSWNDLKMVADASTADAAYNATTGKITKLPAKGHITLSYTYEVKKADAGKALKNAVTVGTDKNTPVDKSEVGTKVDDYEVAKSVTRGTVDNGTGEKIALPDTKLTYSITITNKGETVLNGLVVTDTWTVNDTETDIDWNSALIEGLTVTGSKDGSSVKYTVDATNSKQLIVSGIAVGETATITYTVTVTKYEAGGSTVVTKVKNAAIVNEGGNDPHETNEVETPVGQWSIQKALTLVDGKAQSEDNPVKAGKTLTYTVTVTNDGKVDLYELAIADKLTVNSGESTVPLVYLDGSVKSADHVFANGILDVLHEGESVTLQYTYEVKDADMFLDNVSTATKTGKPEGPDDPTDPPSHTETSNHVKDPVYRDLDVLKVWKDSFGNDTLSDELLAYLLGDSLSIEVELLRDGESLVPAKKLTLDAAHDWKGTFENLPATAPNGTPYTYSVKESEESGTPRKIEIVYNGVTYTFEVSGGSVTNASSSELPLSATLTNTIQNNTPSKPTKEADEDAKANGAEMDEEFQFTIKRKSHVAAVTTATITDALNEYLEYVETVSVKVNGAELEDNQYSVGPKDDDDQTIIWTIPNVPPMADIEVVFTVKVTDEAIKYDEMENSATVDLGDDSDDKYTTDTETVDVKLPKLKITKTADVQSVQPGGDLEYKLVVKNFGDGKAKGVEVVDTLPPYLDWTSLSFVPANASVTGPDADGKITWTIADLASDAEATLTIKAKVNGGKDVPLTDDDGEYVREFTNTATITDGMARDEDGEPKEPEEGENRSDDETTDVADLVIVKDSTDDAAPDEQGVKHYKAGNKITYTLTVTNIGGATLSDVKVSDGMIEKADKNASDEPDLTVTKNNGAATNYTYANGVITLTDPLSEADVVVITYVYTITQTDLDTKGSIPNIAKVNGKYPKTPSTGNTPDPEPDGQLEEHQDDDETEIPSEPSLTVEKELVKVNGEAAAANVHVKANDVLIYQITVTNTGNVTLTLNVQDLFQNAAVALTATGANAGLYNAATKTISGLAPQASITFEYTYNAVKGTDAFLKNVVTVTGSVPKNPEDLTEGYFDLEESDTVTNVVYRDLEVTKIWTDGNDDEFDPELLEALIGDPTITVALYRSVNGGEAAEVPGVTRASLNKANNWTATFSDLPAATDDGHVYTYEVREIGEANGKATVSNLTFGVTYGTVGGPDADGLMDATVTNKLKNADEEYDTDKTADEDDPATGDNDGVEIGDTITYTVTRQSHLSSPSKATIIDVLPEGLDYNVKSAELKVTVNGHEQTGLTLSENVDGQTVTWTVENVPPMATVTITYTVTVNADAIKYEELENDAKVGFGDDPTDESIFKGDSDTVEVLRPELVITKLANVDTVKPGTEFQYTLTVVNHGEGRAEAVVVEDLLPEHVTYKSCDPADDVKVTTENGRTKLTWKVGDLSNEEDGDNTAKLTVTVTVNQDEDGYLTDSEGNYVSVISNTAIITEGATPLDPDDPVDPDDPDGPYTSTFDTNVADLRIEKTGANEDESKADSDIYMAGDKYVYTIVVENIGNVVLTNVKVEDTRFDKALIKDNYGITVVLTNAEGEEEILDISPDGSNVLTIPTLNVGELVTIHYVYEITLEDLEDVELHVIENTATTKGTYKTTNPEDPEEPEEEEETNEHSDTDELPVDAVPALDVEKSVTGMSGKRGKDAYALLNDVLTYTVIVTNTGNVTLTAVEVEDDMFRVAVDGVVMVSVNGEAAKKATVKGNKITIAEIPVEGAAEITYSYVVTQQDILNGHVYNKVTADADDPHDKLEPKSDDEDVDTDEMHSELKLTKRVAETSKPKNGKAFVEGETVTFEIVVTNDGNVTREGDVIDEQLAGATFVAGKGYEVLSGGTRAKIAKLDPNESITLKAVYTVKQQDVVNGSLLNVVVGGDGTTPNPGPGNTPTPTPTNSDGTVPTPTPKPSASVEVTPEKPNPLFTITKTVVNVPANGKKFTLNETIKYEITVKNTGNVDLTDVTIKDQLKNVVIVKSSDYTVIEGGVIIKSMPVGATVTIKATYVVTEADILAGSVENVAVGSATGPHPNTTPTPDPDGNTPEPGTTATPIPVPDPTPGVVETDTVPKHGHLTLEKEVTNTPESGEGYALGETITYSVKVTNDGNLTITDIVVDDELTGGKWTVASLAPGESKTFTTSYVVTEADVLAGSVLNVVTAKGKSPDPEHPDVPVDPDEVETPTEPKRGHLTLEKTVTNTPANGKRYVRGETITYEIKVINDGNLTITDIVVNDELTGDVWTIKSLKPGESKTFTTSYVVTEADILVGRVLNVATAKGKSPDPENPDVPTEPGEVESETTPKYSNLTVTKEVTNTPADGNAYGMGETITYTIKVLNDGNQTLTNIVVTDELTGGRWEIASLAPWETRYYTTSYVVTKADLVAGRVLNVATATGKSPDPDHPTVSDDSNEVISPTKQPKPDGTPTYKLTKTETNLPDRGYYLEGETVEYTINVLNTSSIAIIGFVLTDQLNGATVLPGSGYTVKSQNQALIERLNPGQRVDVKVSYKVTKEDMKRGSIRNVASGTGTGSNGKKAEGNVTEVTVPTNEDTYDLTIHYYYLEDGSKAAPDHVMTGMKPSEDYDVLSPEIEGFWTLTTRVSGKMPAHNVEITVFYVPDSMTLPGMLSEVEDELKKGMTLVLLDEYGVPMGIGSVTRNVGDCFE